VEACQNEYDEHKIGYYYGSLADRHHEDLIFKINLAFVDLVAFQGAFFLCVVCTFLCVRSKVKLVVVKINTIL
jgi:hypothetical protein